MKTNRVSALGIVAVVGIALLAGCRQKSESESTGTAGVAERTGAALDRAAEKTAEAANAAAEKTGEALEKADSAVEGTVTDMQK